MPRSSDAHREQYSEESLRDNLDSYVEEYVREKLCVEHIDCRIYDEGYDRDIIDNVQDELLEKTQEVDEIRWDC